MRSYAIPLALLATSSAVAALPPNRVNPGADARSHSIQAMPLDSAAALEAAPLEIRALSDNTQNDLTSGSPCKAITVIFARGTGEAGNVGTLAGPPFFQALANAVGGASKVAVQGVNYAANVAGFNAGGDPAGSTLMAQLAAQAQTQCPDTKLVLSGYSQGGQLAHNAAEQISSSTTNFVNSVVIFGDPDNGEPVGTIPASKVDIICHIGDDICLHGNIITPTHLNYAVDAPSAASFVKSRVGSV